MPGLNGTGPMGAGPMTGRGMGRCGGGLGYGRGRGMGRGFGWGIGWCHANLAVNYRQPTADDLEAEKSYLEDKLSALKSEIANLKKKK